MTDKAFRTSAKARQVTRRNREERADATVEVPVNDLAEVACPECDVSTTVLFAGDSEMFPSFSNCWSWDCDAFLKFVWNGIDGSGEDKDEGESEGEPEHEAVQAGLDVFAGGESA